MPICEVEVRKKDGTWMGFIFKIDSGADTTLMNESDCNGLGYSLANCPRLEFNTSGKVIRTRIRMLDMRISGYVIKNVPVAFSPDPIKTLLLGRAKIFHKLDVYFLHKHKNTIFTALTSPEVF